MIDKYHHVEINGVKYRLAEGAEGQHYDLAAESLRPPNAVTVQGENSQKFQVRPDVLLWSLTDWSGGEGQIKYNPQHPNRWRELTGVRVFEEPGTLQPGYYVEDTQDNTGAADMAIDGVLVQAAGQLYLVEAGAAGTNKAYAWNTVTEQWDAADTLTGPTDGAYWNAVGDVDGLYFIEYQTDNIWGWDEATATQLDDGLLPLQPFNTLIGDLGQYLYIYHPSAGRVWELLKAGTEPETLIDDLGLETSFAGSSQFAPIGGKLYLLVQDGQDATVRAITPTTAAGAGFGNEVARFNNLSAQALWAHSGIIYVYGRLTSREQGLFYLDPQSGTYGSLGRLRPDTDLFFGSVGASHQNGEFLQHYFAVADTGEDVEYLYQVDAVSGGMAVVAINEDGDSVGEHVIGAVAHRGDVFWSTYPGSSTKRVMRARSDQYTKSSEVVSPWHDFDLADAKILSSLTLACEALPADWTIYVDYARNGDNTWTNVITYNTTSGVGTTSAVSTDSSTVDFRTLSIRIRMVYGGAGVPTSGPIILGVDVRAQAALKVKKWRLLLDLADSHEQSDQKRGRQKITNLQTAGDSLNVVSFKDGYYSREPGVSTEYDVVVDQYRIVLDRPEEGIGYVELLEVV